MTCEEINQELANATIIRACVVSSDVEPLRIQTLFRYPGGEYVDLFWTESPDSPYGEFTDAGQTIEQLLSLGVDPDAGTTRKNFIGDVCRELGVRRVGGQFVVTIDGGSQAVMNAVVRLGQTCVRVADLFVTHRTRVLPVFSEDLAEGLEAIGRPYESYVPLVGRGGRQVVLDYVVSGETRKSGILAISAKNPARAHNVANDAFTKWFDLSEYQPEFQFVTVVDSQQYQNFQEPDISRLEMFSSVVFYPDAADELKQLVEA